MRPQRQLIIRREDDQIVLSRERGLRMEGEKRVQNRERTLGHTQPRPRRADGVKDLPFVYDLLGWPRGGHHLACHVGKRQ